MDAAIKEVFDYIDSFLAGNVDPMEFSWDLQFLVAENFRAIEKVNSELAERMNAEFPEACDMYEYGDDPEPFKAKMREVYAYVKEAL